MAVELLNDGNFGEALASNPKVIVKYYADWCGSCKLFAPKFKRLSNDENNQSVFFAEINAEQNPEARKLAGVDNLPYLATFLHGKLVEGASSSKEEYAVELINQLKGL